MLQAQISRLTGACYHEWEDLRQAVRKENFEFVAGGDTYFTRWYIARGRLTDGAGSSAGTSGGGAPVTLVVSRGVMWRNADVDSLRVWQQLSQSWPTPLMHETLGRMAGGGVVQVHTGIDRMATELLAEMEPHLRRVQGVPRGHPDVPCVLALPSLGCPTIIHGREARSGGTARCSASSVESVKIVRGSNAAI